MSRVAYASFGSGRRIERGYQKAAHGPPPTSRGRSAAEPRTCSSNRIPALRSASLVTLAKLRCGDRLGAGGMAPSSPVLSNRLPVAPLRPDFVGFRQLLPGDFIPPPLVLALAEL